MIDIIQAEIVYAFVLIIIHDKGPGIPKILPIVVVLVFRSNTWHDG